MADFVQKTINMSAIRELAIPIASVAAFNTLIEAVINDNPFACAGYTARDGTEVPAVTRNREHYTGKVNYVNDEGKRVGVISIQSPSIAAFNANIATVLASAPLKTAMGGTAVQDTDHESYYCQLKCHDPAGDDYYVTFTRKTVRVSSYQDDGILETVEEWADDVPALC